MPTIETSGLSSLVTGGDIQRVSPDEQHDDITLIVAKCRG